jgi:surfeit locus 1 family protein
MLRHRWVVWLAAGLLMLVTTRLGLWQLDRAGQKTALHQAIMAQQNQPVAAYDAFVAGKLMKDRPHADWQADWHRPITVQGTWMPEHTVFLDNRQMNGRPGFFVLTPLQLAGVQAEGKPVAWMVQRGWVPRDFLQRERLPQVTSVSGTVSLSARIAPPPARLLELGQAAQNPGPATDSPIRQNLNLRTFAQDVLASKNGPARLIDASTLLQITTELQLGAVTTVASGAPSPAPLLRQWTQPQLDVSKHHGYAAQWFGLSGLTAALLLWFQVIAPRRRAPLATPSS